MASGLNVGNSNLQAIDYEQTIIEVMNDEAHSYKDIKTKPWSGLKKEGRLHNVRNTAFGWTEDAGAFSSPKRQQYTSWEGYQRYFQGSVQLSGGAINTLKKSKNIFRDAVASEMRMKTIDIPKIHNIMYFGDGTGKLGTVQAVTGSAPATSFTIDDARGMIDGATVDVYSSGGTFKGTLELGVLSQELTAAGYATMTVTGGTASSGANLVVATDILYWENSKGIVYSGLDRLIEDSTVGTFQGVSLSSVPKFSSYVSDNGGTTRPLDPLLLRTTLAAGRRKADKNVAKSWKVYCAPELVIEFEEMYEGDFRYSPGDKVVGTPVKAFASALGEIAYEEDVDCPKSKLFLVDTSEITRFEKKKLGWRLQGGQIFLRSDVNNVWTATLDEIAELLIFNRKSSAKIVDLEVENTIAYGQ